MRKYYLDNLRWITVVLVLFYHVLYMFNGEGISGGIGKITDLNVQYYDLFLYFVYPWLMPILFIVSGMSAYYYLSVHSDKDFVKARTSRLLVPSTIGLFVFQFVQGYVNMTLAGADESIKGIPGVIQYLIMAISGIGVLWFSQILWVFSMLLILFRKIKENIRWNRTKVPMILFLLGLSIPVWLSAQVLNTPVIVVYRFGLYGFLFFLGYYLFSNEETIEVLKRYSTVLICIALILGVIFCLHFFGENYADAPVNRSLLFAVYCWFGCLALLAGMARYGDVKTRFSTWMSRHSFGLYVFHYLGISTVALFVVKQHLLPAPIVYLLSFIAGFLTGFVLDGIFSRIPFLRWAVLGIRKGKRKNV